MEDKISRVRSPRLREQLLDITGQLQIEALPISGRTYYVSKFGNNTTGLSWANAFTTIEAAISASNIYIAITANALGKNRIYIDGGPDWEETLTVLPNKCDVIGVGQTWGNPPRIKGQQLIGTTVMGCRFFNLYWYNPTAGVHFQLVDNCAQVEFHNCIFRSNPGVTSTIALKVGAQYNFKAIGNRFIGNPAYTIGIQFDKNCAFGEVRDNFICATATGISIAAAAATSDYQLLIKDNVITRSDPNSGNQLTTGIAILNTVGQSHVMIVGNYISAVDAIAFTNPDELGGRDEWCCIGNWVVNGTTGAMEDAVV